MSKHDGRKKSFSASRWISQFMAACGIGAVIAIFALGMVSLGIVLGIVVAAYTYVDWKRTKRVSQQMTLLRYLVTSDKEMPLPLRFFFMVRRVRCCCF